MAPTARSLILEKRRCAPGLGLFGRDYWPGPDFKARCTPAGLSPASCWATCAKLAWLGWSRLRLCDRPRPPTFNLLYCRNYSPEHCGTQAIRAAGFVLANFAALSHRRGLLSGRHGRPGGAAHAVYGMDGVRMTLGCVDKLRLLFEPHPAPFWLIPHPGGRGLLATVVDQLDNASLARRNSAINSSRTRARAAGGRPHSCGPPLGLLPRWFSGLRQIFRA